ncbi:MAG: ABC transporter permease [Candidatus Melainabacteria bacterium]|nr:ABC transporter permease [Candidatus Melainabacteria bacterium]
MIAIQKKQKQWWRTNAFGFLTALYTVVAFSGFLAPYHPNTAYTKQAYLPPSPIYWVHPETGWLTAPYVLEREKTFNPKTYEFQVYPKLGTTYPIQFFVNQGEPYELFGFIKTNFHLFGVVEPAHINLLGTDESGRDVFSRLLWGGQVSLTIGFVSLLIAFPLGLLVGGIAGYKGGWIDTALMRSTEILMSIPHLFILVSLASIMPPSLTSVQRFLLVSAFMALLGWTGLARIIRNLILSIKQQEFIEAATAMGASTPRILWRHLLPQTTSFLIVAATLGIPGYILAESGLSFLGLGIQQPDASWGNLLKEAQELSNLIERPWLMAPGLLIFGVVLAYNQLGESLRNRLDPAMRKQ